MAEYRLDKKAKYRIGDKVVIADEIPDPDAMPNAIWGWMNKTFYGEVTGVKEVEEYEGKCSRTMINIKIPSPKSGTIGMFEGDTRMRKANFLERFLYKAISDKSWPIGLFYLDKTLA
jgi:hypothetical protein